MAEYKLSHTASEIDEKLGKVDEIESAIGSAVLFTEQNLTDEQRAQARANIAAIEYDWREISTAPMGEKWYVADYQKIYGTNSFDMDAAINLASVAATSYSSIGCIAGNADYAAQFAINNKATLPVCMKSIAADYDSMKSAGVISGKNLYLCIKDRYSDDIKYAFMVAPSGDRAYTHMMRVIKGFFDTSGYIWYNQNTGDYKTTVTPDLIDKSLSKEDYLADAKATGDAIAALKEEVVANTVGTVAQELTDEQKTIARANIGADGYDWHKTDPNTSFSLVANVGSNVLITDWDNIYSVASVSTTNVTALRDAVMNLYWVIYCTSKSGINTYASIFAANMKALFDAGYIRSFGNIAFTRGDVSNCEPALASIAYTSSTDQWIVTDQRRPYHTIKIKAGVITENTLPFYPDDTLSVSGRNADAKATGDAIAALKEEVVANTVGTVAQELTEEQKAVARENIGAADIIIEPLPSTNTFNSTGTALMMIIDIEDLNPSKVYGVPVVSGVEQYTVRFVVNCDDGTVCYISSLIGHLAGNLYRVSRRASTSSNSYIHLQDIFYDRWYIVDITDKSTSANVSSTSAQYLATNNTTSFTPTSDYHPATKKYVDDSVTAVPAQVQAETLILTSSTEGSTKKFKITVDDSGTFSATEVAE